MKLFAVTQETVIADADEYEATHLIGVFSTEALALEAIEQEKAAIMEADGEDDWSEYDDISFYVAPLTLDQRRGA